MNESFESLEQYKPKKIIVNESLLEAKDDGMLGTIVDRGLSFVPRAMRFKKAKKVMKKYLAGYTKKAKNLISKFASSMKSKVNKIEKEVEQLKNGKLKDLLENDKKEEAVKLVKEHLSELESWKKEQMNSLNKGIDEILNSYSSSLNNRIDNPGFILNVELSGKGKGELKAKWQELVAIQNTKIDEYKTNLIRSAGWKKLDEIISELSGFVETKRGGHDADFDFEVYDAIPKGEGEFLVRVHLRVSGGRPTVKEKGVLIGGDPDKLELGNSGVKRVKETGEYQYNMRPYKLLVSASKGDYIVPYLIIKDKHEPVYGDAFPLELGGKSREEILRGKASVSTAASKKGSSENKELADDLDVDKKEE
jgi:hypothetical protein